MSFSLPALFNGDYAVADDLESVTLKAKGGASFTLPNSLRRETTKEMIQGGKLLKKQMMQWILFQADLTAASAPDPKVDDGILDAFGVLWLATKTVKQLGCESWDCDCVRGV